MPRSALRLLLHSLLPILALLSASCSNHKTVHPVRGKVLVDGKPAVGALVQFHSVEDDPANPLRPQGIVGDDGSFWLTTYSNADGAPPGHYSVSIYYAKPSKGGDGYDMLLVHPRYLKPESSGLTADVPAQPAELTPYQLTAK